MFVVLFIQYCHHFADSIIFSPNVLPLSLLTLIIGSLLVALRSHQVTYTLLPDAAICGSTEREVSLLRFILGPNVLPLSVEALNIISQFPVLLLDHVMYTLLPEVPMKAGFLSTIESIAAA